MDASTLTCIPSNYQGSPPKHPIAEALAIAARIRPLNATLLERMIDGRVRDLLTPATTLHTELSLYRKPSSCRGVSRRSPT